MIDRESTKAVDSPALPNIHTETLYRADGSEWPYKMIYRKGTNAETGEPRDYALKPVSLDYAQVDPSTFASIWDRVIGDVNQIATFRSDSVLTITASLPDTNPGGERIQNYIHALNPLGGNGALRGWISSIRPICENTLKASLAAAVSHIRIKHNEYTEVDLEGWLKLFWDTAQMRSEVITQAYEILMNTPATDDDITRTAEAVFPYREVPTGWAAEPGQVLTAEMAVEVPDNVIARLSDEQSPYNRRVVKVNRRRQEVFDIWANREVIGFETDAKQRTAWEGWQAFTQYAKYRRDRGDNQWYNLQVADRSEEITTSFAMLAPESVQELELVPA